MNHWRAWLVGGLWLAGTAGCNGVLGLDRDYQQADCPFEDSCPDASKDASMPARDGGADARGVDRSMPPSDAPANDASGRSDVGADAGDGGSGCVSVPNFCENRCGRRYDNCNRDVD